MTWNEIDLLSSQRKGRGEKFDKKSSSTIEIFFFLSFFFFFFLALEPCLSEFGGFKEKQMSKSVISLYMKGTPLRHDIVKGQLN